MITHEIIGDDMQAAVLTLAAGDEVRALFSFDYVVRFGGGIKTALFAEKGCSLRR